METVFILTEKHPSDESQTRQSIQKIISEWLVKELNK